MGVQWTKEQERVIKLRDRNILVSAAAGSGKTAVLVERIITRLTKDIEPINVDELLIVTFTEAAAAEMKERILGAIEKALKSDPENEHLQKQTALIHNANIMTIHSFCLSVIKNYFYTIDLDPIFRIGDEGELKLIKQDILHQLLDQEYKEASTNFIDFIESFATGKSDLCIEQIIIQIYEYSKSNPIPRKWLEDLDIAYSASTVEELETSEVMTGVMQEVQVLFNDMIATLNRAMKKVEDPIKFSGIMEVFEKDLKFINGFIVQETPCDLYDKFVETKNIKWATAGKKLFVDGTKDFEDEIKSYRDCYKSILKEIKEKYFYASMEEQLELIKKSRPILLELSRLVKEFDTLYSKEKTRRHLIDYNDMEQFALRILNDEVDGELIPSGVAKEYQNKFAEIMIDEYQDSNLVQEALMTSVSKIQQGQYNIFMVGDVKQSIYSFRLSRPELFISKFDTYSTDDSHLQRIDLHKNFRSRDEVLKGTNHVFYKIMRAELGEINYDENAALNLGANFPESVGNELELRIIDKADLGDTENLDVRATIGVDKSSIKEMEARDVALRIKELIQEHKIIDKVTGEYRDTRFSDIAILSRSKKGWTDIFSKILGEENIPVEIENTSGYFQCWEISLLLNYLSVIDNPKQDIPLTAVLTSVFGQLTSEELAIIRIKYKGWNFHEAVMAFAKADVKEEEEIIQRKLNTCLENIQKYREINTYATIYELLWRIVEETNYSNYVYSMPNGEQRIANVELLLKKAKDFESTSYKGLFNFSRYIELLKKNEVDVAPAAKVDESNNAVQMMTIHKSKGLEFPIVFLVGAGKEFNQKDSRNSVNIHPTLGVGINYTDPINRGKYKVLPKVYLQQKKALDNLGEELRVLYVAMTRAKEKLIITGACKNLKDSMLKIRKTIEPEINELSYKVIADAKTYLDWLLPSLCTLKEFDEIWNDLGVDIILNSGDRKKQIPFIVKTIKMNDLVDRKMNIIEEKLDNNISLIKEISLDKEVEDTTIREMLEYEYPHKHEDIIKMKISVTELKQQRMAPDELTDEMNKKKQHKSAKIIPNFMKENIATCNVGIERGNAYHRFMEIWDFTMEVNEKSIMEFIEYSRESGALLSEYSKYLEYDKLEILLNSELGKRMSKAATQGNLFKEQPFVMELDAKNIYGINTEEKNILQGIIDAYFIEDGEIVLIDYKTDKVKKIQDLKERYEEQLNLYETALSQITSLKVKEKIIYSFATQDSIVI